LLCRIIRGVVVDSYQFVFADSILTPLKRKAYSLQTELDRRRLNRQVRSLRQAGFPTKKRFEDLVVDSLPKGQDSYGNCCGNPGM